MIPLIIPDTQFQYQVTVTAGQSTTPKFYLGAGSPAALVYWGDGSAAEAVTSGVEKSHAYTSGGTYMVRLIMLRQRRYLTGVDVNTDKLSGGILFLNLFSYLATFSAHHNLAWGQNVSQWRIPTAMQFFYLYSSSIVGDVTLWVLPSSLWDFEIGSSNLTGDISAWILGGTMRFFWVDSSALTGCPVLSSMVAIQTIRAWNCNLPQATVDLYLSRCVAREPATSYATPLVDLKAANICPSAAGLADVATLRAAGWIMDFVPGGATKFGIIGDSISNGTDSVTWHHKVGIDYLGGAVTLLNHAVVGQSIMSGMDAQVVAAAGDDADYIVLALGTNDNNGGDMGALQAEVEENIAELKLSNPGATIYYMNVLPKWTGVGGPEVDKSLIRAAIAAACAAQAVTCWDTYTIPWILSTDTSDGTHPNTSGRDKIAAEVIARLP